MLLFARRAASKRSIRDHPRNGSNVGRRGWRQFEALRNIRGVVPSRRFSPMDRSTQQRLRRRPSGQTLVEVSEPPAVIDKKNSGSAEGYELLTAPEIQRIHNQPLAKYTTVLTPATAAEVLAILRSSRFRAKAGGPSWVFRGQGDQTGAFNLLSSDYSRPRISKFLTSVPSRFWNKHFSVRSRGARTITSPIYRTWKTTLSGLP